MDPNIKCSDIQFDHVLSFQYRNLGVLFASLIQGHGQVVVGQLLKLAENARGLSIQGQSFEAYRATRKPYALLGFEACKEYTWSLHAKF